MTADPCYPVTGMYPDGFATSYSPSEEAQAFVVADEREVLEELSALTVEMSPLAAARALFVPTQRSAE